MGGDCITCGCDPVCSTYENCEICNDNGEGADPRYECVSQCVEGEYCCEGTCVPDPCCDPPCDSCSDCVDGECVSTCTPGQYCCAGTCQDTPCFCECAMYPGITGTDATALCPPSTMSSPCFSGNGVTVDGTFYPCTGWYCPSCLAPEEPCINQSGCLCDAPGYASSYNQILPCEDLVTWGVPEAADFIPCSCMTVTTVCQEHRWAVESIPFPELGVDACCQAVSSAVAQRNHFFRFNAATCKWEKFRSDATTYTFSCTEAQYGDDYNRCWDGANNQPYVQCPEDAGDWCEPANCPTEVDGGDCCAQGLNEFP